MIQQIKPVSPTTIVTRKTESTFAAYEHGGWSIRREYRGGAYPWRFIATRGRQTHVTLWSSNDLSPLACLIVRIDAERG